MITVPTVDYGQMCVVYTSFYMHAGLHEYKPSTCTDESTHSPSPIFAVIHDKAMPKESTII